MSFIALAFALEIGALGRNAWVLQGEPLRQTGPLYYTEFEAEITAWDILFVNARLRTDIVGIQGEGFDPIFDTYDNTFGIRLEPVEIGYRWLCMHPIQTYVNMLGERDPIIEGAYAEFYIRIESRR